MALTLIPVQAGDVVELWTYAPLGQVVWTNGLSLHVRFRPNPDGWGELDHVTHTPMIRRVVYPASSREARSFAAWLVDPHGPRVWPRPR